MTPADLKWGDGEPSAITEVKRKPEQPYLLSDKLDFETKTVTKDEEGHYILIKGAYPPRRSNNGKYLCPQIGSEHPNINQLITNIEKLTDTNIIIVGDFTTPLTAMDKPSKQKINKETMASNDSLDQMDLTDIFKTFHPKAAEYIFFSSVHRTFSRRDHILGHKSALNK